MYFPSCLSCARARAPLAAELAPIRPQPWTARLRRAGFFIGYSDIKKKIIKPPPTFVLRRCSSHPPFLKKIKKHRKSQERAENCTPAMAHPMDVARSRGTPPDATPRCCATVHDPFAREPAGCPTRWRAHARHLPMHPPHRATIHDPFARDVLPPTACPTVHRCPPHHATIHDPLARDT